MTLPRINALLAHWAVWPPAHIAMALAWLERKDGGGTPTAATAPGTTPEERAAVMAAVPQMPGVVPWRGPPPMKVEEATRILEERRNGHRQ